VLEVHEVTLTLSTPTGAARLPQELGGGVTHTAV
jgi:hypothetical protein